MTDGRGVSSVGPRPLPRLAQFSRQKSHISFTMIPNGAGLAGRDG